MKSKINIINLFVVCLIFSLCSSAFSEETTEDFKQWSIAIAAGSNNIQLSNSSVDDQVTSGAFEVGYQLDKNIGIKVGSSAGSTFDFLSFLDSLFGLEVNSYEYDSQYIAATARTDEDLHIFGSAGIAHITETLGSTIIGNELRANSNKLYWEAGVGWDVTENFEVGLSYTDTAAEFADVSTVQFKIKFNF